MMMNEVHPVFINVKGGSSQVNTDTIICENITHK